MHDSIMFSMVRAGKNIITDDLLENSPFGAVLISSDENVSVMVNEEDHIREQVILSGLSLDQAYDRVNRIDDILYYRRICTVHF